MNEFFTKNDLKTGMAAITRKGEKLLFLKEDTDSFFVNEKGFFDNLKSYDDDLVSFNSKERDIMKIYKGSIVHGLDKVIDKGKLIFNRKEIDWTKVPVDTKIRFTLDGKAYVNRYFAKYENDQIYAFRNGGTSWSKAGCIYPVEGKNVKLFEDNPDYYKKENNSPLVEEFREIEGFSNYKISNLGKIISKERITNGKFYPEKEMRLFLDKRKKCLSYSVHLRSDDKKVTTRNVAWFVAKAFIPNPENKEYALLKDKNKPATVDNIFWANTRFEKV